MSINIIVSAPPKPLSPTSRMTKEDVWGVYDEKTGKVTGGMIVARKEGTVCPVWKDKLPYKTVTAICTPEQEAEVSYWLQYVHGGDSICDRGVLTDGRIALRSEYMC